MQVPVYNQEGAKVREVEIDPSLLDERVRRALLKESYIAYMASQRQGTHSTKTRSSIHGSGAKPFKQKGTGRARAGCKRSPIWIGGAIAHGPHPRDYHYRLPRGMRRLAVRSALRHKLQQTTMCAVEGLEGLEKPQTRLVGKLLGKIGLDGKGILFVSEANRPTWWLSVRNIPRAEMVERRNLNAGQMIQKQHIVFSAEALDALLKDFTAQKA